MSSIAKRPDGQWRARYRDDDGREHARHFARKVDAQRWLNSITASVVTGTYVDPSAGAITVRAFSQDWLARQVWTAGTLRSFHWTLVSCPFVDRPIKSIRRSDVELWVKDMSSTLAPQTVHNRVVSMRGLFLAATRDKLIAGDPSEGVVLPRRRRAEAAMVIPSPEDVGRLLRLADDRYAPFVALCAFAGLRLGEAAAVQVGDVDFLRRQLSVQRQIQREPGTGLEVRAPKYGSERVVAMPDELLAMLARHVEVSGVGTGGWLFGVGGPPARSTLDQRWRRLRAAADLPTLRLHDLRHFYASGLIASGCDVVTVQRALGHSSASITLSTYAHVWPSAEDRTRQATASLMASTILADQVRTTDRQRSSDVR